MASCPRNPTPPSPRQPSRKKAPHPIRLTGPPAQQGTPTTKAPTDAPGAYPWRNSKGPPAAESRPEAQGQPGSEAEFHMTSPEPLIWVYNAGGKTTAKGKDVE